MSARIARTRAHTLFRAAAATAGIAIAAGWAWLPQPAAGEGVDSGDAVIVDGRDSSKRIYEGNSAAVFTLRLPRDASCPGDSANDDYRIQSFIIPAEDDPGTLRYELVKPEGDSRWALYHVDTSPFLHQLTQMNEGAGEEGRIGGIPALSFAVFPPGEIPPGRYRIGIACTYYRETERYWDTEIVMASAPDDEPGQMTWKVAGEAEPSTGPTNAAYMALPVAGAATAVFIIRRPRRRYSERVFEEQS